MGELILLTLLDCLSVFLIVTIAHLVVGPLDPNEAIVLMVSGIGIVAVVRTFQGEIIEHVRRS